jgi:ribonucleoside-diphosphate reductase alpha subunit
LQLKKNTGKDEQRTRDLFMALWCPDLFFQRVVDGGKWSLFCPNEASGLSDAYGKEFEELYTKYEKTEGLARKTMEARDLWFAMVESQIETGTPYLLNKDQANLKSNQKNLGTIKSSNLCTVSRYAKPRLICIRKLWNTLHLMKSLYVSDYSFEFKLICLGNLASMALPRFVDRKTRQFDFQKLYDIVKVVTRNLNKIIDRNYYPIPEAKKSNMRHRPIGLGVQGLADVFILMRYPWETDEAKQLNRDIFETIYFAALTASCEIAQVEGPYETYPGSPVSQGILQYDMWGVTPSDRWDWASLKEKIALYGVRNSLLVAPMPTASTAQILGNNEGFEPYTSNMFVRAVLSGDFPVINKHLIHDLVDLGIWNADMRQKILAADGSIQYIAEIPQPIKDLYKTVWEINPATLIDMAADRGAFVDQSQSFNIFIAEPDYQSVTNVLLYGWSKKLKTLMYYLRTRPAADAIKFTVDVAVNEEMKQKKAEGAKNGETKDNCQVGCFTCGS